MRSDGRERGIPERQTVRENGVVSVFGFSPGGLPEYGAGRGTHRLVAERVAVHSGRRSARYEARRGVSEAGAHAPSTEGRS